MAGLSKQQGGQSGSVETHRALSVTSNWLKKHEVPEMDPGMTMAGPRGVGVGVST